MKKILLILIILIFANFSFSYTPDDIIWNGYINVELEKDEFGDGENIAGSLYIYNLEDYPILSQKLIFQIGKGFFEYPSQFSSDNIVLEKFIETEWILPNSIKRIDFNLENNFGGERRLDVYAWISKSKFNGANSIFWGPTSKNFKSNSQKTDEIYINRQLTNFGNEKEVGPVGFPVSPNTKFPGEVFITNESNEMKENLKVRITVCDWSTAFCEKEGEEFDVGTLNPEESKIINVELNAPEIPSAYEINMELLNGEEIISIYKNRVIVEGGTSKIRKIVFRGLENKKYEVFSLISGSPDHFNYPDFENFKAVFKIFLEEEIIEESEINKEKIAAGEIQDVSNIIESESFDRICLSIEKNNLIYDEECFNIELEEVQKEYDKVFPEELKTKIVIDEENSSVTVEFYKIVNTELDLLVSAINTDETLFTEELKGESPIKKTYDLPEENIKLIVNDQSAKRQYQYDIQFKVDQEFVGDADELISCPGLICGEGTVCNTQTVNSKEGACCYTACVKSNTSENEITPTPLIFIISIFIIIFAIVVLFNVIKKGGKKK